MSIRVYRLLRNNREEGPFTSEELIQKNLKPYDLIWIDGRSAAWNYPAELPEFKNYAPLPQQPGSENSRQQTPISASVQAAVAINNLAAPELTQKPRYRISAAWSKIQTVATPSNKTLPTGEQKKKIYPKMVENRHFSDTPSKSLSWEEAWLDWEKEKKITPAVNPAKTKAIASKQSSKNAAPVLETKYTASLDDLKDNYIEHIINQKQKANRGFLSGKAAAFILPTVSLIIIFSAGYWLLYNTNANTVLTAAPAPVIQPEKTPVISSTATGSEQEDGNAAETHAVINHAAERKPLRNTLQSKQSQPPKQQNSISAGEPKAVAVKQVAVESSQKIAADNYAQSANTANPVINNYNDEAMNNTQGSYAQNETVIPLKTHARSTADYVLVPQRITMTDGSASLTVKNISDINLDLIVINVQYFDIANVYRKGETMYLHHLRAGKNTIIKTPKDANSVYAIAKVSLVSADAENISVIGDN